jgi:hypothetical protein
MPRGGKRPGAGAPKGNLNALKHGRYSRQFAEIAAVFAASPSLREALVNAAERHGRRQTDADQLAWNLLQNTLARAVRVNKRRRSRDGLSIVPPALNQHTNKGEDPQPPISRHENAPKTPNHLRHNQTPRTNPRNNHPPGTRPPMIKPRNPLIDPGQSSILPLSSSWRGAGG